MTLQMYVKNVYMQDLDVTFFALIINTLQEKIVYCLKITSEIRRKIAQKGKMDKKMGQKWADG